MRASSAPDPSRSTHKRGNEVSQGSPLLPWGWLLSSLQLLQVSDPIPRHDYGLVLWQPWTLYFHRSHRLPSRHLLGRGQVELVRATIPLHLMLLTGVRTLET